MAKFKNNDSRTCLESGTPAQVFHARRAYSEYAAAFKNNPSLIKDSDFMGNLRQARDRLFSYLK